MDPKQINPAVELEESLNNLKAAHRQAINMQLWDQIPLLKSKLIEANYMITNVVGVLNNVEIIKN